MYCNSMEQQHRTGMQNLGTATIIDFLKYYVKIESRMEAELSVLTLLATQTP